MDYIKRDLKRKIIHMSAAIKAIMAKNGHGVSSHTHTQGQRDHYANQLNPNSAAYASSRGGNGKADK